MLTPGTISTVAGGLGPGRDPDATPAVASRLRHPSGVLVDRDGTLLIADSDNNRLCRIDREGRLVTVAGNPSPATAPLGAHGAGYDGDGGPAVRAHLFQPTMMVIDSGGNILIADRDNDAIRRVDLQGTITTVAGGNGEGYLGDDGPARDAHLYHPRGLAIDTRDNLYLTDRDNHLVRRIDAAGVITSVAGGHKGYSGDGGPARRAAMLRPRGLGLDRKGNLYIADRNNHAIRKVTRRGRISTWAGGNGEGYSGDGGPAVRATFRYTSGIVFGPDGSAYVSDHLNHAIRKIDRRGTITTVVGGNGAGLAGDGGDALAAQIQYPSGVDLGPDGALYVADRNNDAVRRVEAVAAIVGRG